MKIVITGTSQGLGECLFDSISCYKKRIKLLAVSRRFTSKQIALAESNNSLKLIYMDFSNIESVKNNLDELDTGNDEEVIFINNAATIGEIKSVGELHLRNIIDSINTNFVSPIVIVNFLCKKSKLVTVINISSGAANHPIDKWGLYCSTKNGIKSFLEVASIQNNIDVINIDPGVMDTCMQNTIRQAQFHGVDTFIDLKKKGNLKSATVVAEKIFDSYVKDKIIT
ncbi:MAG: SDR family NAD(P)-dependent oxidoreductase [Holosporaceae bacterium]|jgi:benzil reductase ((S)-benzoin forming)|nr:SDR family NAD(P)-dependent oxidoreductase [Holosporaceae bacterium]